MYWSSRLSETTDWQYGSAQSILSFLEKNDYTEAHDRSADLGSMICSLSWIWRLFHLNLAIIGFNVCHDKGLRLTDLTPLVSNSYWIQGDQVQLLHQLYWSALLWSGATRSEAFHYMSTLSRKIDLLIYLLQCIHDRFKNILHIYKLPLSTW
jgi:hypothetical protein